MRNVAIRTTAVALLVLSAAPTQTFGKDRHLVFAFSDYFSPSQLTIQEGDTVRWMGRVDLEFDGHNVVAEDHSFKSGPLANLRTYSFTFTQAGVYPYRCNLHHGETMAATITVEAADDASVAIDPGHSGIWWHGPARDGEGAQIEVSDGGDGELDLVVTFYSYGPAGGQIYLVGVGTPQGGTVDVDLYITDGGAWGDGFDADDVTTTQWGTGTFRAESCDLLHMSLTPNLAYQTEGYTDLEYDLVRLTTPKIACPYSQ